MHAIGQEVLGLKDQSLLQLVSQQQQLDTRERIEKYLKDATQPKGSRDELSLQQEHTSDNDSSDDEDGSETFLNLELVKKFLISSKAFESLRVSISELAAQGEESTTEIRSHHNVMELENKVGKDEKPSDIGIKQSPFSRTVIPESRTILQAGRLNVFATLQRCSWLCFAFPVLSSKLDIGDWNCNVIVVRHSMVTSEVALKKITKRFKLMGMSLHRVVCTPSIEHI